MLYCDVKVFYSFKYGVAQAKLVWKRLLNPQYDANDNFFCAVYDIYGSFEQTSPCVFIVWMITVLVLPIVCLYIPMSLSICFLLTPPFLSISYIAYRISPITDRFFLRDELIFCIKIMAINMCLHLILFLCFALSGSSRDLEVFQLLLETLVSSCCYVSMCYVITLWVLRKIDCRHIERPSSVGSNHSSQASWTSGLSGRVFNVLRAASSPPPDGGGRPNSIDTSDTPTLRNLVRDKHGFNLFMTFSSKELSVENLLFICEVHQFKVELAKQHLSGKLVGWNEDRLVIDSLCFGHCDVAHCTV